MLSSWFWLLFFSFERWKETFMMSKKKKRENWQKLLKERFLGWYPVSLKSAKQKFTKYGSNTAHRLTYLLHDPAAPGLIPSIPEIFSEEKKLLMLQRLNNIAAKRKVDCNHFYYPCADLACFAPGSKANCAFLLQLFTPLKDSLPWATWLRKLYLRTCTAWFKLITSSSSHVLICCAAAGTPKT